MRLTTHFVLVILSFIFAGSARPALCQGGGSAQNVVWTNVVNATATGNSLQKTSGCDGCDDAGATSQQSITSGDGYFEFTVSSLQGQRFAGLSNGSSGTGWAEIDFAFRLWGASGDLDAQENGTYRPLGTTYAVGDVLRVAVEGGAVKYYKNGTLLYTSTVAPTYPLLVDTSLLNASSTINNAVISQPVNPTTIRVEEGGDFQAALGVARPGDTIELAAGATFTGPFTLPNKPGTDTNWITIRTSAPDSSLPPAGQRITPAYSSVLPKVVSPGFAEPALRTSPGAHHYRFTGVEFRPVDSAAFLYDLIKLGDSGTNQDAPEEVPHHIIIDRCYIYAFPTQGLKRGILLNSAHTDIIDSYIAGFKVVGQEAQAIAGFNGPGPFKIINNYLEGAGENLIFGGAAPSLPDLVPSDIEIKRNYFFKPLSWREGDPSYAGQHWAVKNILELKNAQRVVIEGNVFENCWADAQAGFAILFTARPNDSGPAAVVQDVQFINNIFKNSSEGVNLLSMDNIDCPPDTPYCWGRRLRRVVIANNLFQGIGAFGGNGHFLQVLSGTEDVTVEHNTVALHTGNGLIGDGPANTGFIFKNNLLRRNNPNAHGVKGDGTGEGMPSLNQYFPNADFRKNLIYGVTEIVGVNCSRPDQINCYPANNFYPPDSTYTGTFEGLFVNYANGNYRLAANSGYKGAASDGTDPGVNQDLLEQRTAHTQDGQWAQQQRGIILNGSGQYGQVAALPSSAPYNSVEAFSIKLRLRAVAAYGYIFALSAPDGGNRIVALSIPGSGRIDFYDGRESSGLTIYHTPADLNDCIIEFSFDPANARWLVISRRANGTGLVTSTATVTNTANWNFSSYRLSIGANYYGVGNPAVKMDWFRWSAGGAQLAFYEFDVNDGQDTSGNGQHLTLYGSPAFEDSPPEN
ncbi:MAG TPA: hypothetical protein VJ842_12835 [Pyrinomonadaceae bacterium]|nr:hypothetical protein [Pyrinomonadaceae bacterium]